jgi:YVTN family beta-propeller protein
VAVVDVATRRVTARVPVGDRPWGAAYLFNQAAPTTR